MIHIGNLAEDSTHPAAVGAAWTLKGLARGGDLGPQHRRADRVPICPFSVQASASRTMRSFSAAVNVRRVGFEGIGVKVAVPFWDSATEDGINDGFGMTVFQLALDFTNY